MNGLVPREFDVECIYVLPRLPNNSCVLVLRFPGFSSKKLICVLVSVGDKIRPRQETHATYHEWYVVLPYEQNQRVMAEELKCECIYVLPRLPNNSCVLVLRFPGFSSKKLICILLVSYHLISNHHLYFDRDGMWLLIQHHHIAPTNKLLGWWCWKPTACWNVSAFMFYHIYPTTNASWFCVSPGLAQKS